VNLPERYTKTGKKFTSGGMSTAILCHDAHLDREVIIKLLHASTDEKRLLDEIQALSTIRSKHVVEIYDVIRNNSGKIRAIVEEYVPGPSLTESLGKCDDKQVILVALAISSGLADIHDAGQIHRDLKPQNIKFDLEGCLKIFDFGLARQHGSAAATIGIVGTLGYLAPELCVDEDDEAKFTQAVDVFAFASTILALIRGSLPKDLRAVPPKVPCPAADFHNQIVALPKPVADILNSCFALDPDQRPLVKEVRDILAAHVLQNQHRATLVVSGVVHVLHAGNPAVNVTSGVLGAFNLKYDGLGFVITPTTGSVYINNLPVTSAVAIPGSCVITLGPPSAGLGRVFVPIDVSHPEVIT
jgi:eukaryotic-like serine/threonine-protein kinase